MQQIEEEDPTLIRSLKGHRQSIMSLDLHPTCKYVASSGMDNVILLWDMSKQTPPYKLIGHKNQINDLRFSPNGNILVSASNDESLKFWQVDFDSNPKQVSLVKAHSSRIRAISFSCDGLLLASCGDDKLVKVWSTIDRRLQYTLKKHQNWTRYCQFSPTATNIVSCDDKLIHVWDLNQKKVVQTYKSHNGVIHQVKFHSLGNCMASCSQDKKIKLYDLRSQNVIQVYEGHTGPVKDFNFHPHSPHIISSSQDNTVKIWNTQKGKLEYTLQTHSNQSNFSRQGDYFVSGGSGKVINIWKTGFYDSLKEKITGSQQTINANRKKVIPNTEKDEKSEKTEEVVEINKINFQKNNNVESRGQRTDLIYNHEKENFELLNLPNTINTQKQTIPQRLVSKLQRITNQLDFITKTTQILEARVINNGEQLQRILSLIDM